MADGRLEAHKGLIAEEITRTRLENIRNASRLVDLIEQRKREGRVRILRSSNAEQ